MGHRLTLLASAVGLASWLSAHAARSVGSALPPAAAPRTAKAALQHNITPYKPAARIWSREPTTWIYSEPNRGKPELGYIRLGQSLGLLKSEPTLGPGCARGFYAVAPYGYVCLDRTATLDASERYLQAARAFSPQPSVLPFRYGLSNGAPMYRRLPTPDEWQKAERFLGAPGTYKPLSWGNKGHEELAETRIVKARDTLPFFFAEGGSATSAKPRGLIERSIPLGSMLAFTQSFEHAGRTWLLSADGNVVPADRIRPYRESTFAGVKLDRGFPLPLAFIREKPRPKYRRAADGSFAHTGENWSLRSAVGLVSSEPVEYGNRRFLETREKTAGAALFLEEQDATLVAPRDKLPFGIGELDRWLIVSITRGTLIAYEGLRPVFATLASAGAGGIPVRGQDPVKMSTTPLGVYRITFKHRAATMSPQKGEDRDFWLEDVPHTQYFNAPFALHTAYWHEDFGRPKSAGCVNVSPQDGAWLFSFTQPHVPDGWNGAIAIGPNGKGSFVVVVR